MLYAKKARFDAIEPLRFLFAILICVVHCTFIGAKTILQEDVVYSYLQNIMLHSTLVVDFFFIVSGFLLAYKWKEGRTYITFIKRRLLRVYPLMIFVMFAFMVSHFLFKTPFYFSDNIASLLFLPGIGVNNTGGAYFGLGNNHPSWFVAALLVGESLFFFIYSLLWNKKRVLHLVLFVLIIYSLRAVYLWQDYLGINLGLWRSILGMSLGYVVAIFVNRYQLSTASASLKHHRVVVTTIESLLLLSLLKEIIFHTGVATNIILLIINFAILLMFLCLNKGAVSQFLSMDNLSFFGKYAFSIYITHALILEICLKLFYPNVSGAPIFMILVIPVLMSIIFGIMAFYLIEKPLYESLKKYL